MSDDITDDQLRDMGFKVFRDKWETPMVVIEGNKIDHLKAGVAGAKYFRKESQTSYYCATERAWAIQKLMKFLGEE